MILYRLQVLWRVVFPLLSHKSCVNALHRGHVPQDNYGAIGLLDWLHGTDVKYKKHLASKRLQAAKAAANLTQ